MTTIHLTIHLHDDDALTPDEVEALCDLEVFPVSCDTCAYRCPVGVLRHVECAMCGGHPVHCNWTPRG